VPAKPKAPADPKKPANAHVRLASGLAAKDTEGFVAGQLYVDDLVDSAEAEASKVLAADFLAELLAAIEGADSYEAIRMAVLGKYRASASPEELRELTRKALVLAELAGVFAVQQDAQ
jgi:hypothetical protein